MSAVTTRSAARNRKRRGNVKIDESPHPQSAKAAEKPTKKSKKKSVAVAVTRPALTDEDHDRIDSNEIEGTLRRIVQKLARQVDDDWHDGWEEQARTKAEWFRAIEDPLQAVLDIGVAKGAALSECNEVLKIVADTFYGLLACPCRCDTKNDLSEMDETFRLNLPWGDAFGASSGRPVDSWSYVWVALLRAHSSLEDADEDLLLRCIRDAHDNMEGADTVRLPGFLYDQNDENYDIDMDWMGHGQRDGRHDGLPSGTKLAYYVNSRASDWKSLPTTKEVPRRQCAIDRRFDGAPERRTRNWHWDDSDFSDYDLSDDSDM